MTTLRSMKRWFQRPLSCEDVNRFIVDYLEDTIPARTRAKFEAHLEKCPVCGAYFDQYLHTVTWVREDGSIQIDPPEELVEVTLQFLREHYSERG